MTKSSKILEEFISRGEHINAIVEDIYEYSKMEEFLTMKKSSLIRIFRKLRRVDSRFICELVSNISKHQDIDVGELVYSMPFDTKEKLELLCKVESSKIDRTTLKILNDMNRRIIDVEEKCSKHGSNIKDVAVNLKKIYDFLKKHEFGLDQILYKGTITGANELDMLTIDGLTSVSAQDETSRPDVYVDNLTRFKNDNRMRNKRRRSSIINDKTTEFQHNNENSFKPDNDEYKTDIKPSSNVRTNDGDNTDPNAPLLKYRGNNSDINFSKELVMSLEKYEKISKYVEEILEDDPKMPDKLDKDVHRCVINNDIRSLKWILHDNSELIEKKNDDGKTPLILAAEFGYYEICQLLVHKGANIEERCHNKCTALMYASSRGNFDIAQYLLRNGAEVDSRDKDLNTPLIIACEFGHIDVCHLLIKYNADVDARNESFGNTSLMVACERGFYECARLLLVNHANVCATNFDGHTALLFAAKNGHLSVVELLLLYDVNVNEISERFGKTPLIYASINGHADVCDLLLRNGANVNARNQHGFTALMYAAHNGQKGCCEALLNFGADINMKNNDGNTALIIAASRGFNSVVDLLLERNSNTEIKNRSGISALIAASRNGHLECVKSLLIFGADPNEKTNYGYTPLMYASRNNYPEIAKILIDHHAIRNENNNYGLNALTYAERNEHEEIIDILKNYY